MDDILTIESLQNPRVKTALRLRKSHVRHQLQQTLVEGCREILRATDSGWNFKELYYCPSLYVDPAADELASRLRNNGIPCFQCTESVFRKLSYRDTPDGLMALSPLVGKKLEDLVLSKHPLVLIAEDLEKPGNLGTILRTADATGVDAVVVSDPKTDINNPNVIRASIGTLFFMPIAEAATDDVLQWLARNEIQSIATMPEAELEYTNVDMRKATAIIVGAEDKGLSVTWKRRADLQVGIPMLGQNDSLNVSTAAAIILYEAVRQRRAYP